MSIEVRGKIYVYVELETLRSLQYRAEEYDKIKAIENRTKLESGDHSAWQGMAKSGERVNAIMAIRQLIGCGVKEALNVLTHWEVTGEVRLP